MVYDGGSISSESKRFNSAKQITEFTDQRLIKELLDAFYIARRGYSSEQGIDEIPSNKRVANRVKGLYLITQALRDLIMRGRGDIESDELAKWSRKQKEGEGDDINEFYKENNDFSKIEHQRKKVKACEMDIREADKTASKDDDFMLIKETNDGEVYELTDNYFEMIDELEDSWREIEVILKKHEIFSQGMTEDEEITYKEQEELYLERFKEA